jgi:hypothetical protein
VNRNRLTYQLAVALILAGSLVYAGGYEKPGPDNRTYRVRVVSSFETEFIDCYRFDTPNPVELTIDLLFQTIPYRHGQLDTVQADFKAVSLSGQALSIMFFGTAVDPLERLNGEAVNEFGDTFVFSGREAKDCEPEPFEAFRLQRDSTTYQRRGD